MRKNKFETEHEEAKYYHDRMVELSNTGERIYTKSWTEEFIPAEGEEFKQCWADTPERCGFPKKWFVSEESLLSILGNRIILVRKNFRKDGSAYYIYTIRDEENGKSRCRSVEAHNLVWLTWGISAYGKAEKLLREKGVDAFGINNLTEDVVQGHHKNSNHDDNSLGNGKFATDKVHNLLSKAPSFKDDSEKQLDYTIKLGNILSEENPTSPTILFTGEHGKGIDSFTFDGGIKDVMAIDENTSKEDMEKLSRMQFYVVGVTWIPE